MTELDYNVIATGSTGNAVRIGSIMIDCGIPFKKMREDLYKVDTLLITHTHSDHVKESTLDNIRNEFPRIKVYGNYDVAYQYEVDTVVGTSPIKLKKNRVIIPFDCFHDVPCTGYVLQMQDMNILYATDTAKIEAPELPYDYVFLESNYDERKLKEMAAQYKRRGYDPYTNSSIRHLSTQQCKEFYYVNRKNKDSKLIELHQSKRFY